MHFARGRASRQDAINRREGETGAAAAVGCRGWASTTAADGCGTAGARAVAWGWPMPSPGSRPCALKGWRRGNDCRARVRGGEAGIPRQANGLPRTRINQEPPVFLRSSSPKTDRSMARIRTGYRSDDGQRDGLRSPGVRPVLLS